MVSKHVVKILAHYDKYFGTAIALERIKIGQAEIAIRISFFFLQNKLAMFAFLHALSGRL
jgi:hypothetical protein